MTQIFRINTINGLPETYPTINIDNIPLVENLSDNFSQIMTQSTSSVYVASDPVGAKISIDGVEQAGFGTPTMITDIPPGHHTFKLSYQDRADIESDIPLEPGKTYNIFLTLGKSASNSTSTDTSTDVSGIVVLLTLGLIGYFLIKK
jgi:hypothetical protein